MKTKLFKQGQAKLFILIFALFFFMQNTALQAEQQPDAVNPPATQVSQELSAESRQILQHELKILMEDRRKMAEAGAKSEDIKEITRKIQEKSNALASQPPLISRMPPDGQRAFDQQFFARKSKLDELGRAYKELIDRQAPKEEVDVVIQQINEARGEMQRFVQTSMQPMHAHARDDHSGHQH